MQVTLENLSGLERKLSIVLPVERIKGLLSSKLDKICRTAKFPGFRPGKVPMALVQKRHGDSARIEVLNELIHDSYIAAIKQENLKPVGNRPNIDIISDAIDAPFEFTATFEVFPTIAPIDLSELEYEKYSATVTDADVDSSLENLRKRHATWQEVSDKSRKSQAGDQITVDFTVKTIGESGEEDPEVSTEKDVKFVLGSGAMWADFEKHLYGLGVGEKTNYKLEFPKTHIDPKLTGKTGDFNVEIRKLCEPILPELNDDFAKKLGIKKGGVNELKVKLREQLERELAVALKNLCINAVIKNLLDNKSVEIPNILIEDELNRLAGDWESSGQKTEFPRESFLNKARNNVSLALLLGSIVDENDLKVDVKEIQDKIEEICAGHENSEKIMERIFNNRDSIMRIQSKLLEEKAVDLIISKAKTIEKEISCIEAIEKSR